jgi:hypothetical protein
MMVQSFISLYDTWCGMKGKHYYELLTMKEAQRFLPQHEFGTDYNIPAQNVSIESILIFT